MIDEAIIGAAPWRWRTGRLNRRNDEIDDGSSSGAVDEGLLAVAVDDPIGDEAPVWRWWGADQGGWGFAAGGERFWRPRFSNGEKKGMGGGNHDLRDTLLRNVG
jgi:hypothetical protein